MRALTGLRSGEVIADLLEPVRPRSAGAAVRGPGGPCRGMRYEELGLLGHKGRTGLADPGGPRGQKA